MGQIALMQKKTALVDFRIVQEMVEPETVAGGANNSMNLVILFQQQFGQIRAVLAGNAGDERPGHCSRGNFNSAFLMRFEQFDVGLDHELDETLKSRRRFPTEFTACFAGVTDKQVDLSRAHISWINFDILFPIQTDLAKRFFEKLPD